MILGIITFITETFMVMDRKMEKYPLKGLNFDKVAHIKVLCVGNCPQCTVPVSDGIVFLV